MTEKERDVLAANDAFYEAFIGNDYPAMESLWANDDDIVVIHPGWPPLHGRRAVLDSWQRILSGEGINTMHCSEARVYLGDVMAFVVCNESFPQGDLVATNIFTLEQDGWKLVHHHAGPNPSASGNLQTDAVH